MGTNPLTGSPSAAPVTPGPTLAPTPGPTLAPTDPLTGSPSAAPVTTGPTAGPTPSPTLAPTPGPTPSGTESTPIAPPTPAPTDPLTATPTKAPSPTPGGQGDPHFMSWKGEHFEYHGQCDMVLAKDEGFANGLGLFVHIRTKVVRNWSYIKNVAIRIGKDTIEIEGHGVNAINHHWINSEYLSEQETIGGFPLITHLHKKQTKRTYEIDLGSMYPNQKIAVSTWKEFVKVDFKNGNEESYGNIVGLLGSFKTGQTLARDGKTNLDDFSVLGSEWQVHPNEPMLFREVEEPQFPQKCVEPEDPQGERRRRLDEMTVAEDEAEAACAHLANEWIARTASTTLLRPKILRWL